MEIGRRSDRFTVVLVAIFVVTIAVAAVMSDFDEVLDALKRLGIATVVWMLGLSLVNYALRAIRWQRFAEHLELPMPPAASIRIFIAGLAMGATPARAGEAVRLWLMRKQFGIRYRAGGALMIADRASDLNSLALLAAIGASLTLDWPGLLAVAAALLIALNMAAARPAYGSAIVGWVYRLTRPRLRRPLASLKRMLRLTASTYDPRMLLTSSLLGCLAWMAEGLAFGLVLASMGADIGMAAAIGIYSISSIVGAASTLPGGLGGFEGACVAMLIGQGVPAPVAIAATAVIRLGTLWFSILLGFLFLPDSLRQASVSARGSVAKA